MLRVPQGSEMVMGIVGKSPLKDHVCHHDLCDSCCSGMERLKPHHWLDEALDKTMVLFKDIVEIFALPDFNDFFRTLMNVRIVLVACCPTRLTPLLSMTTL